MPFKAGFSKPDSLIVLLFGLLVMGCRDRVVGPVLPIPIDRIEVGFDMVKAFDKNGDLLFQKTFTARVNKAILVDVDHNDSLDVVIGTEEDTGKIMAIRADGRELWKKLMFQLPIYNGPNSGRIDIRDLVAVDILPVKGTEVVAIASDAGLYPSRVSVLQGTTGQELTSYWNPGNLGQLRVTDFEHDGRLDLLAFGLNNDLRQIRFGVRREGTSVQFEPFADGSETNFQVLVKLNPSNISGQAPPFFGTGVPKGSHEWYGVFMPQGIGISELATRDIDQDGIEEIHVSLPNGIIFDISPNGRVLRKIRGDGVDPEVANQTQFILIKDCFVGQLPDGSVDYICEIE